jgi:hypothetical protein
MTIGSSKSRGFTRCLGVPSPDKNREWAASGIDRSRRRPVAFALPTVIGSFMSRPPHLLLRSTGGSAVPAVSDPMEEGRW